jgi:hypothetical protein
VSIRAERGTRFEEIVFHIERGDLLDILEHPKADRYAGQRIFVVRRAVLRRATVSRNSEGVAVDMHRIHGSAKNESCVVVIWHTDDMRNAAYASTRITSVSGATPSWAIASAAAGLCMTAFNASMSGTSITTATRFGFCGSTNVRMLVTPSGPNSSFRFGERSQ